MINFYFDQIQSPTDISIYLLLYVYAVLNYLLSKLAIFYVADLTMIYRIIAWWVIFIFKFDRGGLSVQRSATVAHTQFKERKKIKDKICESMYFF